MKAEVNACLLSPAGAGINAFDVEMRKEFLEEIAKGHLKSIFKEEF